MDSRTTIIVNVGHLYNVQSFWKNTKYLKRERQKIISLKQAVEASLWIEKLIWIFLGVVGSAYFAYLLVAQVNSWDKNSILVSKEQRSIDEIDFTAITFCAQGSTKYAIAERIGNSLHSRKDFYQ